MAELEEGSGTEASDAELLEQFDSIQPEDYARWADHFFGLFFSHQEFLSFIFSYLKFTSMHGTTLVSRNVLQGSIEHGCFRIQHEPRPSTQDVHGA